MDRGGWRAMVHRVTKSQTQLKHLSRHAQASKKRTLKRKDPEKERIQLFFFNFFKFYFIKL